MIADKKISFLYGLRMTVTLYFFTIYGELLLFAPKHFNIISHSTYISFANAIGVVIFLLYFCKLNLQDCRSLLSQRIPLNIYPLLVLMTICIMLTEEPVLRYVTVPNWNKAVFTAMAANKWLFFTTTVILAPVLEEFVFRGMILGGMLKKYTPWQAVLFSTLLFSLIHMNPAQSIGTLFFGLVAGWSYVKFKNLLAPITIHATNNCIAWYMMTDTSMKDTNSFYDLFHSRTEYIIVTIVAVVSLIIFMVVFSRPIARDRRQT